MLTLNPAATLGVAVFTLALPVAIAAWLRRRALAAPATDVAAAWFGYARRAQWLVIGGWLSWITVLSLTGAHRAVTVALHASGAGEVGFALWLLSVVPPALSSLAIQTLTHDVQRRLRGSDWTLSEHLRCSLWQLAALLVPMSLLFFAPIAFLTGHAALGAFAAIGVLLTRMWFLRLYTEALGLAPHAVTTGPLRDRLFDLARRAGVPLRQLYVIPTTRGRLANAFAMNGGSVMLTDYLLDHLSEREVTAALAHEIGHLRYGHPRRLALTLVLSLGGACLATQLLGTWFALSSTLTLPLAIVIASFVTLLVTRGFERVADAAAIDLTGDPEALITALARLSQLNHVPLDWGAWAERSLTHPSTRRRAHAIGRRAGLDPARVDQLLASLPPAASRFSVEMPEPGERPYSTLWKARVATNIGLILLGLQAVIPTAVIAMLRSDHPSLLARLATGVLAAITGAAVTLGAVDALAVRPYLALRRRIVERSIARGLDPERCGGRFVGLAPTREARLYEHTGDWDVGHLFLMRQRLCYLGEESRFELKRAQVISIELAPGLPGWISAPRVVVTWHDPARGTEGALAFRPAEVVSLAATAAESRGLCDRLRGWQRGVVSPNPDPALEPLGPPPTGAVTSLAAATMVAPAAIARTLILCGLAAAAACAILGVSFDSSGPGFLDALLATWAVALFHRAPYWMRAAARGTPAAERALDRAA